MKKSNPVSRNAFTLVEVFVVMVVICVMVAVFLPQMVRPRPYGLRVRCSNNLKQIGLAFKIWALDNNDRFPMQVSVTNGGTMELVSAGNVWPHFLVMSNELSTPRILFCPEEPDKQRTVANTFLPYPQPPPSGRPYYPPVPLTNDNHISYFVGVDADNSHPQMMLAGDHNLSIGGNPAGHGLHSVWTNTPLSWVKPVHEGAGNVLLVDGSVQRLPNSNWHSVLIQTGVATNRLAVP